MFLDNDSYTFTGDESAAVSGQSVTVSPIVYLGTKEKTVSITGTSAIPTGMSATISSDKKSVTFAITKSGSITNAGAIDISFTVDGKNFSKTFSYAVTFKGGTGTHYNLTATPNIVKIKHDGSFSPASITFTS